MATETGIPGNIIPRTDGTVVEREERTPGIYWIHVYGPNTTAFLNSTDRVATAQARRWAADLGMTAGGWVSSGGGWNGVKGGGNHAHMSYCYAFRARD